MISVFGGIARNAYYLTGLNNSWYPAYTQSRIAYKQGSAGDEVFIASIAIYDDPSYAPNEEVYGNFTQYFDEDYYTHGIRLIGISDFEYEATIPTKTCEVVIPISRLYDLSIAKTFELFGVT